jgi:hypothetical protein
MKKIFAILLLLSFGFMLTACELEDPADLLPGQFPPLPEYVERASDPEMIANIPPGGLVYMKDFTVDEAIESFDYEFNGTNKLTYVVDGIGMIESTGFNSENELGRVVRQDEEGLHFHVRRIGDWSGNGTFVIRDLIPGNLEVTAGAYYQVYVEAKWVGLGEEGRLLRIHYAGYSASDGNAQRYGDQFESILHRELYVSGITGEVATLGSTANLELRVGWTGNETASWWNNEKGTPMPKQADVDHTLVLRSIKVYRGATSSLHTTTPENSILAYAMGGENVVFDGTFISMFVNQVGKGSQLPAAVFTGLQLVNGHNYQLSFQHEAGRRRSMEVFIGYYDEYGRLVPLKDSPERKIVDSFSSRVTETWNFTWEGASIHDALLVVSYGDVGDFVVSTSVKVGNLSLVAGE